MEYYFKFMWVLIILALYKFLEIIYYYIIFMSILMFLKLKYEVEISMLFWTKKKSLTWMNADILVSTLSHTVLSIDPLSFVFGLHIGRVFNDPPLILNFSTPECLQVKWFWHWNLIPGGRNQLSQ